MLSLILVYLFLLIPPDKAYEGARLQDEGDYERAAQLYREALEESPNDWTVIYNLGVVLYEKNEPQNAAVLFDSIISQDSVLFEMKSDILYNSGTSYLKAAQNCQDSTCPFLEKAIDRLVKSLILNPFDDECRRNLEIALRMKSDNQSDQQDQNNQSDQNDQNNQSDQQDQNNQSDQNDQNNQSDQQDQNNQSDQNDQNNQSDQQDRQDQNSEDQNPQDSDQSDHQDQDQQDQNNQSGQNETPFMTKEQAERILDAALNSPGQDSLLPQDNGKSIPSGQW